ncbi:MAG: hypothetical protein FJ137_13915 [Deltaproteobacteria bacterium]|nr:hypothetical protein [Deltaproteobacteria bacterium]
MRAGLRGVALRERMRALGARGRRVEAAVELASPLPVDEDPVQRMVIHGAKGRLLDGPDLDPRLVATRAALQAALVLREPGRGDDGAPDRVAVDLVVHGFTPADIDALCADAHTRLGVDDVRLRRGA